MSVKTLSSEQDFTKLLKESAVFIAHFSAEWSPHCLQMTDVLEELSKQDDLKNAVFSNISAEDLPEISEKFNITSVPTVLIFRNGALADRVDGANFAELTSKVKKQVTKTELVSSVQSPSDINERIKSLINSSKCMVFMKGSPTDPKCGFSRKLVDILSKHSADYKYFDVFTDEVVRQQIKSFSNWPTFPQVYIDGELVGGLDIINELDASGELKSMLPAKKSLQDRLKEYVNRSPVMIFMKGSPAEPRCGFSKQLMLILNETGVKFDTFDILKDEEVRQGLKQFSNWPTYPQIYVKGELIGGLDIIKELKEDGSLISTLKGE